jgi:hypothetical protein
MNFSTSIIEHKYHVILYWDFESPEYIAITVYFIIFWVIKHHFHCILYYQQF